MNFNYVCPFSKVHFRLHSCFLRREAGSELSQWSSAQVTDLLGLVSLRSVSLLSSSLWLGSVVFMRLMLLDQWYQHFFSLVLYSNHKDAIKYSSPWHQQCYRAEAGPPDSHPCQQPPPTSPYLGSASTDAHIPASTREEQPMGTGVDAHTAVCPKDGAGCHFSRSDRLLRANTA